MDYTKFIRSRSIRIGLLRVFSFVPDRFMIQMQYRIKTGKRVNLKNPIRYSEKLQWYKLYYRNSLMKKCADKYEVRAYVAEQGYQEILNSIYGLYESANDIDFDILPNEFVIKDTLGGGGASVVIVKDKTRMNLEELRKRADRWTKVTGKHPGREWVYEQRKNRILIERLIPSEASEGGLIDYKFFCFWGKVKYLYVIADRTLGSGAGLAIYDRDFQKLPYIRADERVLKRHLQKPEIYEDMLRCAEKLSTPFPHTRIDLYNCNGQIVFGEITFFDGSGYMRFEPDEFDFILGREFDIHKIGLDRGVWK